MNLASGVAQLYDDGGAAIMEEGPQIHRNSSKVTPTQVEAESKY